MKTSNIILSIVIGSITLLIISGFVQVRFFGQNRHANVDANNQSRKIDLPNFQYLVINDVQPMLRVSFGNQREMELWSKKDTDVADVDFRLEGDTLFIEKYPHQSNLLGVNIYVPQGDLKWIECGNANLSIENYNGDVLSLMLNQSRISINGQNHFGKLNLTGINGSNFQGHSIQLDTLDLFLDNSQVIIHAEVQNVQGELKNGSEFSVRSVNEFNFKKDKSSRLNHWE